MAIEERDPHTGYLTTGHEWNGIKELNTPVPRVVYFFLGLFVVFSVIYSIAMPAWPLGWTYTKGLLGINQRDTVAADLAAAAQDRAVWTARLDSASAADIAADPALMKIVMQHGRTLFGDNCSVCHGVDAKGGRGFPSLRSGFWLWGGDAAAIAETIRVGINADHPDTRNGQMLAFGHDQILTRLQVEDVVQYVRSLGSPAVAAEAGAPAIENGKAVFGANCASCHGEDGRGKHEFGAPNLTDASWIYGGDRQSVFTTVWQGRKGLMPSWEGRLSPTERKMLALYVLGLQDR